MWHEYDRWHNGGDVLDPLVDYEPGEYFGPVVYTEPRQRVTVMEGEDGDRFEVVQEDMWHRLDMVSWSRVGAYFDEAVAKHQARYVFATVTEGAALRPPTTSPTSARPRSPPGTPPTT